MDIHSHINQYILYLQFKKDNSCLDDVIERCVLDCFQNREVRAVVNTCMNDLKTLLCVK